MCIVHVVHKNRIHHNEHCTYVSVITLRSSIVNIGLDYYITSHLVHSV